ncbi:MAG: WG repeat-containing protein [Clostridia bacterium]|nr:WG repeat-containing protein [Clostridia bacterium]
MYTKKRNTIQIIGLAVCILITAAVVLFAFLHRTNTKKVSESPQNNDPLATDKELYDPIGDVVKNGSVQQSVPYINFVYKDEIVKFQTLESAKTEGFSITSEVYDESCRIVLAKGSDSFSTNWTEITQKVQKVVTEPGNKGGYFSKNTTENADAPLLQPYYGYIIYKGKDKCQLLDSNGNLLLAYFSGYEPAYTVTLFGSPLFKKDGKYYYYHDSSVTKGVFYDQINEETFATLPENIPTAYQYLNFDKAFLYNYYVKNEGNEAFITETSAQMPTAPGMVEYTVDENTLLDIQTPEYNYKRSQTGLYPFYTFTYTDSENPVAEQIFWGYMDEKGDVVIEPVFKAAYPFSDDGYAVVLDTHEHLCTIDVKGRIVYNPYDPPLFIPEMGNKKIRDTYYMPDTYGTENTGMFRIDNGHVLMRRRLVDTESGYLIKRETRVVISAEGQYLNYPNDYNLISYSNGMLLLEKDGLYGYMNYLGEWVIEPVYRYALPFSEGLAVVGYRPDKLGMINTKGELVMPYMYSVLLSCSGGMICAYENENGWTVYNKVSTAADTKDFVSPMLTLKYRAIAEVKQQYALYLKEEEEKKKQQEEQNKPQPETNNDPQTEIKPETQKPEETDPKPEETTQGE